MLYYPGKWSNNYYYYYFFFQGSTEVTVYSAQGINDPVTSAMHIIFGECSFITYRMDPWPSFL